MGKNIFNFKLLLLSALLCGSCAQTIKLRTGLSELVVDRISPKELKADVQITSDIKDGEIPLYDWKMEEGGMFDKYEYKSKRAVKAYFEEYFGVKFLQDDADQNASIKVNLEELVIQSYNVDESEGSFIQGDEHALKVTIKAKLEVDYKGEKITKTVSNSLEKFENIAPMSADEHIKIADHLSRMLKESFGKLVIKTDNVLDKVLR